MWPGFDSRRPERSEGRASKLLCSCPESNGAEYVPSALRDSEPRPERSDGAAEFLPQLPVFAAAGGGGLAKNSEPKS
ncbi:MAG: hypothetical protein COZ49_02990 [Candidatus Yonathbacteria bacterium CG_4_10_14_3_um_filter_47_65]|uniref:Uncharacterized protein n=1 Tax=Candidatus Yonathbacteria bacterium CG_4_9_14_0_8_um_filter_46_47 TaxID=1975106 RepID=A0A2M8D8N4_9BACT|nr:MAG: hypothetical protein COZ49_02990 [Candidatus Yonathbacteria bacterium CG_4_10_14_3_um_filter_47_65]PJB83520.1 MAG: hypothetical protein CO088_01280 [Candidatus Yonathbacteria bacterium CG_4_9_14_0_8_um_filter_46_47]PJC19723.1 MAG: hypothetical protein CO061_04430 [Candidatus Yonathbacteria bacterium CG_4_9_14_0_2_um_filter_47_74]